MNSVFRPHLRRFVLVFFDDILVYSGSWKLHLEHLATILQLLKDHKLVAKEAKSLFGQKKIDYLGHVVSEKGLSVDPTKIQAILQWPVPRNVKEVRSFLGLAGYYRRFIRQYASIASPITDLLRKETFKWTDQAQEAFEILKKALGSALVLSLPDFSLEFHIETDDSRSV
ncbi:putative mitochondrial protein AtMg00860 [Nicotiana tabacum]|uniref:Mitochondrial protein AtMg00860 n=1 Tax=Nicotiana tabacum TaxID=4097 RepID=A0AC58TG19_TOBAC